jgi:Repeat of Unknown Function (DUF347)
VAGDLASVGGDEFEQRRAVGAAGAAAAFLLDPGELAYGSGERAEGSCRRGRGVLRPIVRNRRPVRPHSEPCGHARPMTATVYAQARPALRQMLNKVPEVTLYFWVIKVLCTTVGETASDYLSDKDERAKHDGDDDAAAPRANATRLMTCCRIAHVGRVRGRRPLRLVLDRVPHGAPLDLLAFPPASPPRH